MPRWLYFLLIFAVLAPVLDALRVPAALLFVVAGLGIVPLAALIGQSVEQVAEHTGERAGGLLFATFGNATELIIGIFALLAGLTDVVRASIIGSILSNALLVLGVSTCVGSIRHGRLHFETRPASQYSSLLALCIGGLMLPTFAELLASHTGQLQIAERNVSLSVFIAVLLLAGYLASILFSVFRIGDTPATGQAEKLDVVMGAPTAPIAPQVKSKDASETKPNLWLALLWLALATAGVAMLSEILVGSIEPLTKTLGWNTAFVGLIFIPLIANVPEYFNTITMALDKRMEMVLAASAGSSIQIALLIAPILVLVSLAAPHQLDLVFSIIELAVLGLTTFLFSEITRDGELVWLEGLLLILLYAMMGGTVFLFGA